MEIVSSRRKETILPDVGLDGKSWDLCFARLVEGEGSFSVACGEGYMRDFIRYVHEKYIFVKAAGGIVRDGNGRLLLMRRYDRWDLPKGKVEPGETLAQAALRETEEETGITNVILKHLLLKTYHIYDLYGGWHFKQTSWFDFLQAPVAREEELVPQAEEGITEVGWYDEPEWVSMLKGSYATMNVIIRQLFENKCES